MTNILAEFNDENIDGQLYKVKKKKLSPESEGQEIWQDVENIRRKLQRFYPDKYEMRVSMENLATGWAHTEFTTTREAVVYWYPVWLAEEEEYYYKQGFYINLHLILRRTETELDILDQFTDYKMGDTKYKYYLFKRNVLYFSFPNEFKMDNLDEIHDEVKRVQNALQKQYPDKYEMCVCVLTHHWEHGLFVQTSKLIDYDYYNFLERDDGNFYRALFIIRDTLKTKRQSIYDSLVVEILPKVCQYYLKSTP